MHEEGVKKMMQHVYSTAVTTADYQDAALLCLLWYLFGRASDLTLLRKVNLPIGSGDIFFVRFIRVKTSEEQGLSLFPDDDFPTCPLLAVALALVAQTSPTSALLSQLPEQHASSQAALTPATPLIDLMDHPETVLRSHAETKRADEDKSPDTAPGIHSYVNRALDRIAGVAERLTSHSFRRGGAQHANGAGMCVQWIFDHGAWNMTATNKAFAYVFNTPSEDHIVARVLSSRDPEMKVLLFSLDSFDSDTQTRIRSVASALFVTSLGLKTAQYNVNARVADTLMAYLLRHYPELKSLASDGLAVQRMEACTIEKGFCVSELLAWSSHLSTCASTKPENTKTTDPATDITTHSIFLHQAALIEHLIQVNQKPDTRLTTMEANIYNKSKRTPPRDDASEDAGNGEPPVKRRRTSAATSLKDAWFSWYAQEPRMWSSTDAATKQKRSNTKLVVAFMKLFLGEGFVLDGKSPQYRDDVLELGATAERELLSFLREHEINARGAQNVLKSMRKLYKAGHLNALVRRYNQLQAAGRIGDPAPAYTTNLLGEISTP
ncbi:hypothetical protein PF010_g27209 [Phytophthora fragariae]|uniref:Uncharacterized protein n=2 Tax=Phytophthora fragariae TaxID=53985 RepID=A0A6G0JV36_9STRA|nr:hypothetical protein PF010_g27209 [Phytophthora fragariae]KAE9174356.1 hypothetical protein PF004_g26684 [Phytophthora fragariae]